MSNTMFQDVSGMFAGSKFKVVRLAPLQGTLYRLSNGEIKVNANGWLALVWAIPGAFMFFNAVPLGGFAMLFFAFLEATERTNDFAAMDAIMMEDALAEAATGGDLPAVPSVSVSQLKAMAEEAKRRQLGAELLPDQYQHLSYTPTPNTQLHALPAKAQSPSPAIAYAQEMDRRRGVGASPQRTAISEILASPYKTRIFFGAQRSGKSMLAAIATKQLADKGVRIFHLNLLSYTSPSLDEDAVYTRHMVSSVRGDLSVADDREAALLGARACKLIQDWHRCYEPSILVVDEWAFLASKNAPVACKEVVGLIAGKVAALASSSSKRCKAVYALAPLMVAGDMDESGKAIKTAQLCYVTIAPGSRVDWNGQTVGFDPQLFKQVQNNFDGMDMPSVYDYADSERIAFINGQWMPLGTDPSMLDWDADSSVVQQAKRQIKEAKPKLNGSSFEDVEVDDLEALGLDETLPDLDELLDDFIPPSTVKVDQKIRLMEAQSDLRYQCLSGLLKAIRGKGMKTTRLTVKDVNSFNWAKIWNDGSKGKILVESRDLAGFGRWLNAIAKMGFIQFSNNDDEFIITLS